MAATWQLAAHAGDVREPGDDTTTEAAGEPLIIRRGEVGALAALGETA